MGRNRGRETPANRGAAAGASGWAIFFAVVHVYWALGGRLGLPSDVHLLADVRLLIADLIAIPLCLIAAAVAAALPRHGRDSRVDAGLLCMSALIALLCLAHSIPPLATGAWRTVVESRPFISTEREFYSLGIYEPFWLAGGLLFASASWLAFRSRAPDEA